MTLFDLWCIKSSNFPVWSNCLKSYIHILTRVVSRMWLYSDKSWTSAAYNSALRSHHHIWFLRVIVSAVSTCEDITIIPVSVLQSHSHDRSAVRRKVGCDSWVCAEWTAEGLSTKPCSHLNVTQSTCAVSHADYYRPCWIVLVVVSMLKKGHELFATLSVQSRTIAAKTLLYVRTISPSLRS